MSSPTSARGRLPGAEGDESVDTVLFDVDGTLVDSNYQHVVAWARAFARIGHPVPAASVHRAVGMGGDRLVTEVAGEDIERAHGDDLRTSWEEAFDELIDDVPVLPGAGDLLRACAARGLAVVLASSGKGKHLEHFRALIDADDAITAATTSDDVEASKPAGDLFGVALERAGGCVGVAVGDAPWDAHGAHEAGVGVVLVRSGGFCDAVLHDAGPLAVFDDTADLLARLDSSPLVRGR